MAAQATPPPSQGKPVGASRSVATFKVDVDLVLVEVGVHDEHGRAVGNLKQEDFRIFENGEEQQIRVFSHEELPLAVALVIDNSSSIMAALQELRAGALDTLDLLKPDDKVAIFSFGETPEMVEGLTSDHEALSVDLWALSPYGGTDINDALYQAAMYLGQEAPNRRRAVILVSDNEPSSDATARDFPQVVRAAQQSGTPIYSVKVGYLQHSKTFFLTHSEPRLHDVEKICRQSGGELIDTRNGTTVTAAMETILKWLKQGYTLGYTPTNKQLDGTYRAIQVHLNERADLHTRKDSIYARPGYYAPAAR
ncbi:MAG: VWA domain-containing protein [Acidobacteriota bacterium]|nr:VWA domain-containing protein [Acidobacteriota bacterium]